jgi:hypothetical protein
MSRRLWWTVLVMALMLLTFAGCGDSDVDGDGSADTQDPYPNGEDRVDSDRDGLIDIYDLYDDGSDIVDSDRDGVADAFDLHPHGEDKVDTDRDGLPDLYDPEPRIVRSIPPPGTPQPALPAGVEPVAPVQTSTLPVPTDITEEESDDDYDQDGIPDGRDPYPELREYGDPDHDGVITRDDGSPTDAFNDTDHDGEDNFFDAHPTNEYDQ